MIKHLNEKSVRTNTHGLQFILQPHAVQDEKDGGTQYSGTKYNKGDICMAKENVQKFFEKVAEDERLKAQLDKAAVDSIVAVAKHAGFDFTAEELEAVKKSKSEKLSDEELSAAAGGHRGIIKPGDYPSDEVIPFSLMKKEEQARWARLNL